MARVLNGYGVYDPWGYYLRNCTSFVAWKLHSLGVGPKYFEDLGDGGNWYAAAKAAGLVSVGTTPEVGAAAVVPGRDHVAYVSGYNSSTGVITVEEYNHDLKGDGDTWTGPPSDRGFTEYVYFAPKMTTPPTGQLLWKLRNANSSGAASVSFYYGASTDTPVTGDWDGNGTATIGIARPDNGQLLWKLRNVNNSGAANGAFDYGASNAIPTPGNWDGIGSTTAGVVRTDDGSGQLLWELRNASGGGPATYEFHYGPSNAIPVVGDWDGNGTVTIGVVRQDSATGTLLWQLRNSNSPGPPDIEFHYGPNNALPVVGDWNGNGTATVGVVRPINGQLYWELRNSDSAGEADLRFYYGASTDTPVVGDWDGNGTDTVGIVRR